MLSVLLTKEGFSGATGMLEAPQGFAVTHFGSDVLDLYTETKSVCIAMG